MKVNADFLFRQNSCVGKLLFDRKQNKFKGCIIRFRIPKIMNYFLFFNILNEILTQYFFYEKKWSNLINPFCNTRDFNHIMYNVILSETV